MGEKEEKQRQMLLRMIFTSSSCSTSSGNFGFFFSFSAFIFFIWNLDIFRFFFFGCCLPGRGDLFRSESVCLWQHPGRMWWRMQDIREMMRWWWLFRSQLCAIDCFFKNILLMSLVFFFLIIEFNYNQLLLWQIQSPILKQQKN